MGGGTVKTASPVLADVGSLNLGKIADYIELTKPRVGVLVLLTVAAGALLAPGGMSEPHLLFHAVCGTALVVAGASALNQLLERHIDTRMHRTENRPLAAGRLSTNKAALFGMGLGAGGVAYLAATLPHLLSAGLAAFAFVSYVFIYTPLKKRTSLNTLIGAVPGALPPVIGWTAVTGRVDVHALALFLIVYLWQVPHFLAIAWIYREDYARAGLKMLPVLDERGSITGRQMVSYALALIPISLLPAFWGFAGPFYLVGAVVLGAGFVGSCLGFVRTHSQTEARRVLRSSLLYLPALMVLLLLDGGIGQAAFAMWR
jgi:protoheme IX farnesyltransferase